MIVKSIRLGQIEVSGDKLITMMRPILGFESLNKFCLIEVNDFAPFLWLQSTENEAVAFAVVNPLTFWPDFRIDVNSKEIAELEVAEVEKVETYVIVNFAERPEDISANLQGPILINSENNKAKQLVLVNSRYSVRHEIMEAVGPQPTSRLTEEELVTT